jgi:methylmalonyl-CoA mutase N-terminal domain/subunit
MISHGQTGLNVAFDLPTQMGYDSDDPMAEGEVGRVGMAIDSLRDFEIAFKDINLEKIGSGLTINAVASIMLAMYQAVAEKYGFDPKKISATPQNDILKEMIGRAPGSFRRAGVNLIGDTIEYSMNVLPRTNPVSICGYHIRSRGDTRQEIGYAILIANAYIDNVLKRGYDVDDFVAASPLTSTSSATSGHRSPVRAARKLWRGTQGEIRGQKGLEHYLRGLFGGGGTASPRRSPRTTSCAAPTMLSPLLSPGPRP